MIHFVLFQKVNRGVLGEIFWFRLNGMDSRFGLIEFAMIKGLKFTKEMDMSNYVTTGESQLRERYFLGAKHVSYSDLHKVF